MIKRLICILLALSATAVCVGVVYSENKSCCTPTVCEVEFCER